MRNEVIWSRHYDDSGSRINGVYQRPNFTVSKVITQNRYGKSQGPVYLVDVVQGPYSYGRPESGERFFTFQAAKAYGMEITKKLFPNS